VTNLEVVNRALYRLGAQPASSMSDAAKAAARAVIAYPYARDEVLRLVAWPSVLKRATLLDWSEQATPWTASHAYRVGDRCTNDTDKTYECLTAGKAAAAGGPTGTSSSITDGNAVWKYVEASTTANNWCWAASTAYAVNEVVSNDTGKVYVCITAGTSDSSGGPTGVTLDITDNTAHWKYYGTPDQNLTKHAFQYIYPTDCLRLDKILSASAADEETLGALHRRERICIFTDEEDAAAQYVYREEDPTAWDDLLRSAVFLKLASDIAFDVTGKTDLAQAVFQEFAQAYQVARQIALGEGAAPPAERPSWSAAG
jgi:hypothetical protein